METPSALITVSQPDALDCTFLVGEDAKVVDHPVGLSPDLPIHGDGSAMSPSHPLLARAGLSVTQFDADCKHVVTIKTPVPAYLPQTAAMAERLAILLANMSLTGPSQNPYVGDCKGSLQLADNNVLARCSSSLYASFARQMWSDGLKLFHSKWVKAHTTLAEGATPEHRRDVIANDWSDVQAKSAALAHPIPQSQIEAHGKLHSSSVALGRAAAKMLSLWPSASQLFGKLPLARHTVKKDKVARTPHEFVWATNCWVCRVCLRRKFSANSYIDKVSCGSITPVIARILANPRGHRLLLTSDAASGLMYAFCAKCGYYASTAPKLLAKDCCGKKHPRPAALNAIFEVPPRHPLSNATLTRCYSANVADMHLSVAVADVSQGGLPCHSPPPGPADHTPLLCGPFDAGFDDPEGDGFCHEQSDEEDGFLF